MLVEIYPREGTETRILPESIRRCKLKFIPVRGRKPDEISIIFNTIVEIYPREGTETFWVRYTPLL